MTTVQDFIAAQTKEMEGRDWRILPLDAKPEDKFKADMVFQSMFAIMPDVFCARGIIFNDSRHLFLDGEQVRTSNVVNIYHDGEETYLETRNTVYRIIDGPDDLSIPLSKVL